MKKSLENVHVVIYSKKMLKQAFDRLKNLKQNVQGKVFVDFECHDNDLLIFHNGTFKMVHWLPVNPCYEVTLNDLCEMVIDLEDEKPKVKMGDYVITELKNSPSPGFSAYQLSIQNSVDILNAEDTLYNFKVISKERFEELRKVAFD